MDNNDIRDIKLYGTLAVMSGGVIMLFTLFGVLLLLAAGGDGLPMGALPGAVLAFTILIMSAALIGIGGEFQRANRASSLNRENLRVGWVALLLVLVASFAIGLWLMQLLAAFSAVMVLGLVWIRVPIIRVAG